MLWRKWLKTKTTSRQGAKTQSAPRKPKDFSSRAFVPQRLCERLFIFPIFIMTYRRITGLPPLCHAHKIGGIVRVAATFIFCDLRVRAERSRHLRAARRVSIIQ